MKRSKFFLSWPLAILCILFFMGNAQAIPTSRLELSAPPAIYVGDTFGIDVLAGGVTDVDQFTGWADEVLAFGFDVNYDTAQFTYNGATVGPSFFDDSALFPNTDVAGDVGLGPGPSGDDILLASLSFTPLIPGNFTLGIISDLSDPNEGLITLLWPAVDITSSIDVSVASAAPVPEPGTILLLGTGLAGLVGFRKKFKRNS